jgi:hypothetical protein
MKKVVKNLFIVLTSLILMTTVSACGSSSDSSNSGIAIKAGQPISFANDIAGGPKSGWSEPDSGGTWSQSSKAILKLNYQDDLAAGMNLKVKSIGFVASEERTTKVIISANGVEIKTLEYTKNQPEMEFLVDIPSSLLEKNPNQLLLNFYIPNATSPQSLGINADQRKLGIFLLELTPNRM